MPPNQALQRTAHKAAPPLSFRDKRTARQARLGSAPPLIAGCCVLRTLTPLTGSARAPPIKGVRADCASRVANAARFPRCEARGSTAGVMPFPRGIIKEKVWQQRSSLPKS